MVNAGGVAVVDTAVSIRAVPATHPPTDAVRTGVGAPLVVVHVASMP